jgi:transcriptional repressor NrdR
LPLVLGAYKITMKCPFCAHIDTFVLESRVAEDGQSLRRRRECAKCQKRFTTFERVEGPTIFVIKREGGRQPFDREKIVTGVIKSFDKRPVSIDQIQQLADDVEREVRRKEVSEISSKAIGKMVLRRLKSIDKVAWLRFASVYLELSDINEFEKLIEKVNQE